jgi:cobalt/nickel transport protein
MKQYKKYIIFIGILIVLSPIGLFLPDYFKAGDAWGEWSVESVKEQTGHEPEGMKKNSEIYRAPVPDYNLGKENDSLSKLSVSYIISGLIGAGIVFLLTFGISKLLFRKSEE